MRNLELVYPINLGAIGYHSVRLCGTAMTGFDGRADVSIDNVFLLLGSGPAVPILDLKKHLHEDDVERMRLALLNNYIANRNKQETAWQDTTADSNAD